MPSQWLTIDDNFPSFTGKENPTEQIRALHNYLYQLREGLQYSLQNLTADNFNTTALKNLTDEQKDMVSTQLEKVYALTGELSGQVEKLSSRIGTVEKLSGRVSDVESGLEDLEKRARELSEQADTAENAITELDERVRELEEDDALEAVREELDGLGQAVRELSQTVRTGNDSVYIGTEGKPLHLTGQVYINGVLYTQGEET